MEGLVAGDQVVVNPPDSIINGVSVHVLSAAAGQQSKLAKTP
jgi:hypothetical protein